MTHRQPTFFEFFAGGGMARIGLEGAGFACRFANDLDPAKCKAYRENFGDADLTEGDVADLTSADLPGAADVVWASFPCQDLSLAGARAGMNGPRSGVFWPFWRLIEALDAEGRGPKAIVIENVLGLATSRKGVDLMAILAALAASGRSFSALAIDASRFLPQSRPRLFIVAWTPDVAPPDCLRVGEPASDWTTTGLSRTLSALPASVAAAHVPLAPSPPEAVAPALSHLLESDPSDVAWRSEAEVAGLLAMMNERHREQSEEARRQAATTGELVAGCLYKRMRSDGQGGMAQRAEVRFDIAGCLRTPAGGSSRQTLLLAMPNGRLRARLLSAREAARLMGLPDDYRLPKRYNDAYRLSGDGIATPVVRFIADEILLPLLSGSRSAEQMRASKKAA
ncbi:MAG: DNA cytosine methyltransferase [Neomegalonema sp.]